MKRATFLPLIVWLVLSHATRLSAQSIWLGGGTPSSVALEAVKPSFDEDGYSTTTGVLFASGRIALSPSARLVIELPLSHASGRDFLGNSHSSYDIGNPYIGLEVGRPVDGSFLELGGRAPLLRSDAADLAAAIGLISDIDRLEAFAPDIASLLAVGNVRAHTPGGFELRLRAGPALLINTGSESDQEDTEVFLTYGGQTIYNAARARIGASVTGRWVVTEEGESFGDASVHQLGVFGDLAVGNLRPGVFLRVPLDDDMSETIRFVAGLQLQIGLR